MILTHPFYHLKVAVTSRDSDSMLVPGTALMSCPLQRFEVTTLGCAVSDPRRPYKEADSRARMRGAAAAESESESAAALAPGPVKCQQVPVALVPQPAHNMQTPVCCGRDACSRVTRAPFFIQILEHLHVTVSCGTSEYTGPAVISRGAMFSRPNQDVQFSILRGPQASVRIIAVVPRASVLLGPSHHADRRDEISYFERTFILPLESFMLVFLLVRVPLKLPLSGLPTRDSEARRNHRVATGVRGAGEEGALRRCKRRQHVRLEDVRSFLEEPGEEPIHASSSGRHVNRVLELEAKDSETEAVEKAAEVAEATEKAAEVGSAEVDAVVSAEKRREHSYSFPRSTN